jgi:hypothetical protein
MTRFVSLLVTSLCLSIAACGGYSPDEAKTKCDLERTANSACSTDASYNQCLSCYESCGVDCAIAESCPAQYICSE